MVTGRRVVDTPAQCVKQRSICAGGSSTSAEVVAGNPVRRLEIIRRIPVAGGVRHLPARAGLQRAVRAGGRVRRRLRPGGRLPALPLSGAAGDAADHAATTTAAAPAPAAQAAATTRAAAGPAAPSPPAPAAERARARHLDVHAVSRGPWQRGAEGGAQQGGGPRGLSGRAGVLDAVLDSVLDGPVRSRQA